MDFGWRRCTVWDPRWVTRRPTFASGSVAHCDPIWVSCLKAIPTIVLVLPFVVARWRSGRVLFPDRSILLLLAAAAVVGQLAGNVSFQWSLGIVGMAMSVPLTLGTLIFAGAIMGRLLLKEPITLPMAVASLVLILAICVLSSGARAASTAVHEGMNRTESFRLWLVAAGVGAACLSGVAYCSLSVAIRHSSKHGSDQYAILLTVSIVGFVALATLSYSLHGTTHLYSTPRADLWNILFAGVFNAVAFWCLTRALELASVMFVNAINASQVALAAIAGILIFDEATTTTLIIGVALTVAGLLMMRRRPQGSLAGDSSE